MSFLPSVCGSVSRAALIFVCAAQPLMGQGLGARLAPQTSSVWWSDDVGLEDVRMFGGGLSFDFGRFVTLRGSYERAGSVETRLQGSSYGGGTALENTLDASLFATGMEFRLSTARVAPVLTGVGGILGISPDGRASSKQVLVGYGAGLDARLTPWLDGQAMVKRLRFRMDRSALAGDPGGGPPVDPDRADPRGSTTLTVALGARLGGARTSVRSDAVDQRMSDVYRAEGLIIPFQVQLGVLRFAPALDIADRPFLGARSGLDFGQYFGIRGSYSRGVTDSFGSFAGMTSWSVEGQFNLGRVTELSPHLLLGFGQLTFADDYLNRVGTTPDDQNALIVGAGIGVPLDERMRVVLSLRDHITSAGAAGVVSTTADLHHNLSVTAGLSFVLRRGPRAGQAVPPFLPPTGGVAPAASADAAALPLASPSGAGDARSATGVAARDSVSGPVNYQSTRDLSIPIPLQGELYVRYGPAPAGGVPVVGGVSPAPDIARPQGQAAAPGVTAVDTALIGRLVRAEVALRDAPAGVTRADLLDLEVRLLARQPPAAPATASPELSALTRQVEELSRLVREGAGRAPVIFPGSPNAVATELVTEMRAPFLRGFELRAGTSSVRNDGPGVGAALDVFLGGRFSGRIQPFTGVHLASTSVGGQLGGLPYAGSVTSYGGVAGARLGLPSIWSVAPALGVGVSAVAGGTRGDDASSATVVDDVYGGFVMGPRVALSFEWRRDERSPLNVMGSIGRLWAGSRSGWGFQTGVRWSRPLSPRMVVRPVSARSQLPSVGGVPPQAGVASRPDTTAAQAITRPTGDATGLPPADSALVARLDELESALRAERDARERLQAMADSVATAGLAAQARADSLARISNAAEEERQRAAEAAQRERQAEERALETARATLRDRLESLVGIVPDVERVTMTERGLEIVLGGALFPTGSTTLASAGSAQVERVGRVIAQGSDQRLLIVGHTDSTGTEETNRTVSRLRAEAVRDVLMRVGLDPAVMSVVASGEDTPVATNDTVEGRRRNRRVEIVLLDFAQR